MSTAPPPGPHLGTRNPLVTTALELARIADIHAEQPYPQLSRYAAELGLVHLDLAAALGAGPRTGRLEKALAAAESARECLESGTAVGSAADTARARLHLALHNLDRRT